MWKLTVEQGYRATCFNVKDFADVQKVIEVFNKFGEGDFEYRIYKKREEKKDE